MHYVSILAFRLPVPVQYDWRIVLFSLAAAIVASAIALFVVSRREMGLIWSILGSIAVAAGIASMHYAGMAARRLSAMCSYSRPLVIFSVVLAIMLSFAALRLAFHFRANTGLWDAKKIAGAVIMGTAIAGTHYTSMAAASFQPSASHDDMSHAVSISSLSVIGICLVTFAVLGVVLVVNLQLSSLSNVRQ